jgi:hypothetical protein
VSQLKDELGRQVKLHWGDLELMDIAVTPSAWAGSR